MSITKSIGKNTLGGGKGMQVRLHEYHRSTHDLSYAWRSTMTVGTLTPFMKIVALPGDTLEINLDTKVFTHPTIGPLFGSYKLQLDIFTCPMRLYMAPLHNNALNVGMDMSKIKIPQMKITNIATKTATDDIGSVNPSNILRYLGWEGLGVRQATNNLSNALPLLSYIDIFKNYYANKQEENCYYIMGTMQDLEATISLTYDSSGAIEGGNVEIQTSLINDTVYVLFANRQTLELTNLTLFSRTIQDNYTIFVPTGAIGINNGTAIKIEQGSDLSIKKTTLSSFDDLREYLLSQGYNQVTLSGATPGYTDNEYIKDVLGRDNNNTANSGRPLGGLFLKTYQSDIFSNWIQTEWIDGENGINAITAIDTSSGSFSIDSLNLAKKVYDMLNRIAVSGGSYKDWIDTVYTSGYELHAETPIYEGGMSEEIEFQEIVSNSATKDEPLGTLAGRGYNNGKTRKGGSLKIKIKEPSYIMGIVSITPRVDYATGKDWDLHELKTMDDLHKPALDGIGFQDLMAYQILGQWGETSIGKQPAWINYMTAVNRVYGNFAIRNSEMFMTLTKLPDYINSPGNAKWSSYIEPQLYNYIFADTSTDAQNFWVQIGCGIKARRVMSAKQIPNL